MSNQIPVSLYGVGAPATPTLLYTIAKSVNFGNYEGGRCWDTSIHNVEAIIHEIDRGDFVCGTATVSGYQPLIALLRQAKEKGATVAIGGPWVNSRAKEVAEKNPWIDHIAYGEGENSLKQILFDTVPHGLFQGEGFSMERQLPPDFSGWSKADLLLFNENYKNMIASGTYGSPPEIIPAFVFYQSARGCVQRPRCAFCSTRLGEKLSWRTAEQFHGDIESIVHQYSGINPKVHIFDTSDSFTSILSRLGGKPRSHEGVTFTVFSRVDEIDPRSAETLRQVGVTKVSLGVESGSNEALRHMGKLTTAKQNIDAVKTLAKAGIQVYLNFMYGLPGETKESIAETVEHCLEICAVGNVYRAKGRITTPLPGSRWFEELIRDHPEIDEGSDWISPQDLALAWLRYRTHVTLDDIQAANLKFTGLAGRMGVTYSSETAVWFG